MKKIYILVFLCLMNLMTNQAQTISMSPPIVTPVSPEAADVQRYISYPVDYSTGIPDISIPLYEIKAGDIVLPITLSYHSAGLKPKEPSGRVGTGWSLNAEPSIVRSIRGVADGSLSVTQVVTKQDCQDLIDGIKDGEPDMYSYMLNPGSGTFYLATNHSQYVIHPRNNDEILKISGNIATIKNGDGLIYNFGDGDNAVEKTECSRYNPQITRWLCNSITSQKTSAQITFTYTQGSFSLIDYYYNMHDYKIIEQSMNKINNFLSDSYSSWTYRLYMNGNNTVSSSYGGAPGYAFNNFAVQRSNLNNISFNGNTVQFGYNSFQGEYYIDNMIVSDAGGNQIRNIQFFTSRYNERSELIKLDSIRISAPGCQTRTYRFDYYAKEIVPYKDTRGIDHWGFYNAENNNSGGVPTIYTKLDFYNGVQSFPTIITDTIKGALREPNASCTQIGILKEIVNPEGAITHFEYEGNAGAFSMYYHGNDYEKYGHYAYPVGGLRIATITVFMPDEYLQNQIVSIKRYTYGLKPPEWNSPIIGGGVIKHIVTNRDYCFESTKKWQNVGNRYVKTWQAMPISDITFNNGSAVFYSFVQEDTEDRKTGITTTSKYYYDMPPHNYNALDYDSQYYPTKIATGFWDLVRIQSDPGFSYLRTIRKDIDRPNDVYEEVYKSNDWRHGQLIKEEHYNKDKIVSSTDYKYNSNRPNGNWSQVWVFKPYCICDYVADQVNEWNYTNGWPIFSGDPKYPYDKVDNSDYIYNSWQMDVYNWKALEKETNKQYFYRNGAVDTVITVKNYDYSDYEHTNPVDITTENSNQASIEDEYTYLTQMVNTLAYHKRTVNNSAVESNIVFKNNRPQKVQYKTSNMSNFDDKIIYDCYDSYGNVAEITTNDEKHTCYIWSYGNQNPIAKIENITYPKLLQALAKDSSWISELGAKYQPSEQDMNLLNGLRSKLTDSWVSTFTYKPLLGVSTITNASGFTTYYEYDNFGRLTQTYIIESGQKKVLQTNEYNTNNKKETLGNESFIILGTNVIENSILDSGKEYLFKVSLYGGSGHFYYEWILFWGDDYCDVDRGEHCEDPTNKNCHVIYHELYRDDKSEIKMTPVIPNDPIKINKLKVWVTDIATGEEKSYQTWFYVK